MKKFSLVLSAFVAASLLAAAASASNLTVYDPQPAFSSSNPSGVWSYGVFDTTTATFSPFTTYSTNNDTAGVNAWSNVPSTAPYPGIYDNTNAGTTVVHTTISVPGETLVIHPPNSSTQQTDLRFTAPTNMSVNIAATFAAADTLGTTSDVHVFVNGLSLFDRSVTGTAGNGAVSFSAGHLALTAGETVEFRVGDGGNGYGNDGTSLVASITAIPEPSSVVLLCVGGLALLGFGGKRLRRRA